MRPFEAPAPAAGEVAGGEVHDAPQRARAIEEARGPAHDLEALHGQGVERHGVVGRALADVAHAFPVLEHQDAVAIEPPDHRAGGGRAQRAHGHAGLAIEHGADGGIEAAPELLAVEGLGRRVRDAAPQGARRGDDLVEGEGSGREGELEGAVGEDHPGGDAEAGDPGGGDPGGGHPFPRDAKLLLEHLEARGLHGETVGAGGQAFEGHAAVGAGEALEGGGVGLSRAVGRVRAGGPTHTHQGDLRAGHGAVVSAAVEDLDHEVVRGCSRGCRGQGSGGQPRSRGPHRSGEPGPQGEEQSDAPPRAQHRAGATDAGAAGLRVRVSGWVREHAGAPADWDATGPGAIMVRCQVGGRVGVTASMTSRFSLA
jgi:hypothetical protein